MKTKLLAAFLIVALCCTAIYYYREASHADWQRSLVIQNVVNRRALQARRQTSSPRHIFLDVGACVGEATRLFKETAIYGQHPWEIIAFEANPKTIAEIEEGEDVTLFYQAAWVEDGILDFYLAKNPVSSSVIKEKTTGHLSKIPIQVESVDFGRFIRENFAKEDVIWLKMDIEGAEYAVLDRMLADSSMTYVDCLFIEFHNSKVHIPRSRDLELMAAIAQLGIPIVEEGTDQVHGNWFEAV